MPEFYISLTKKLISAVVEICQGRIIIVLCGGSRRDLATYLIPGIIRVLADE